MLSIKAWICNCPQSASSSICWKHMANTFPLMYSDYPAFPASAWKRNAQSSSLSLLSRFKMLKSQFVGRGFKQFNLLRIQLPCVSKLIYAGKRRLCYLCPFLGECTPHKHMENQTKFVILDILSSLIGF
jgi:hypothetical protein